MTKVIQFPGSNPEKFGFKPVRKKRKSTGETTSQLDLFSGGKVRSLNRLSAFEEALMLDEQGDYRVIGAEPALTGIMGKPTFLCSTIQCRKGDSKGNRSSCRRCADYLLTRVVYLTLFL